MCARLPAKQPRPLRRLPARAGVGTDGLGQVVEGTGEVGAVSVDGLHDVERACGGVDHVDDLHGAGSASVSREAADSTAAEQVTEPGSRASVRSSPVRLGDHTTASFASHAPDGTVRLPPGAPFGVLPTLVRHHHP